jgi:putative peptide zinc metalloprotease protein
MSTTVPPPKRPDAPTEELRSAAPQAAPPQPPPRLANGVELIGRFEGSGFKDPPCIARRADGQVVQMAPLLFALADEIDGTRTYNDIAEALSHRIERGVTGEMAEMLIEEQLRPLGIVAPADGSEPELNRVDPLLALKFRTKVVPERFTAAITKVFQPLFLGPVVVAVVAAFVALCAWTFGVHGISQSLRHVIYEPALVLMLLGGVILATTFHEIGHASAVRYGGAKPGVMGVGVYIVWPAFYTDITDSYRLGKKGRLRTDLGGMYFNAIFALAIGGLYAVTAFEPLLLLIVLQVFAIIQQSLPFLRLDGYYIVSDLTGVPDILLRMRPILASLLPWREPDERVTELKPWVRVVVTAYLCVLVPVIGFMFLVMLMNAPRVMATGWDSFWLHWDRLGPQFSGGDAAHGLMSIFQMLVLVLPAAGIVYTTTRVTHRFGAIGWKWSERNPFRRGSLVAGTVAAAGLAAFFLWPHGAYKPIQPGERGTLAGAFRQLADMPSGRPALTPQREQQLGGAPSERQLQRDGRPRRPAATGSAPSGTSGQRSTPNATADPNAGPNAISDPTSTPGTTATTPAPPPPPPPAAAQPQSQAPQPAQPAPQPAPGPTQTQPAPPPAAGGTTTQPSGTGTSTTPTTPTTPTSP